MKQWLIAGPIILLLIIWGIYLMIGSKPIIYSNPISFERFLVGTVIQDSEQSHSNIIFYYILKFGNCPACHDEIQYMNQIYRKFKGRIEFKGIIASCGDPDLQKRFIRGSGLKYEKIIVDNNFSRWQKYGFKRYPVKIITNSEGRVLFADSLLYMPKDDNGKEICISFEDYLIRLIEN